MSHIQVRKADITDLDALHRAVEALPGLTFDREAKRFRYYGGRTQPCDGKISLSKQAFEIGLKKDGSKYNLQYDPFGGGGGMMKVVGTNCVNLLNEYNAQVVMDTLNRQGMRAVRQEVDGKIVVRTI